MDTAIPSRTNEHAPLFETIEGATALLRIPRTAIFELIRQGEIASIRHGKRRLISRRSMEEWANRQLAAAGFAEAR